MAHFNSVIRELNRYGTKGHECLEVCKGVLKTKSHGNWFQRLIRHFYKPKGERIQTVAKFAVRFFQQNEEHLTDTKVLRLLLPTLQKANYGKEIEKLIDRVRERIMKEEDQSISSEEILSDHSTTSRELSSEFSVISNEISDLDSSEIKEDSQSNHLTNTQLTQLVDSAVILARDLADKYDRERALKDLSIQLLKVDPEKAIETARSIERAESRDNTLEAMVAEQVKNDPEGALVTAISIESDHYRAIALRSAAGVLFAQDPDSALELLAEAVDIARRCENVKFRSWALKEITSQQVKFDINDAIATARSIEDASYRAHAFSAIAVELANADHELSSELFSLAVITASEQPPRPIVNRNVCVDRDLCSIAIEQAKVNPEGALDTASRIEGSYDKEEALYAIAIELVRVDLEKAFDVARLIGTEYRFYEVLLPIVLEQLKVDPERAITMARSVRGEVSKNNALRKIAIEHAKSDPEGGIALARSIDNPSISGLTLYDIAVEFKKEDPAGANQIFDEVLIMARREDREDARKRLFTRYYLLVSLAEEKIEKDPAWASEILREAVTALRMIEGGITESNFTKIGVLQVKLNLQEALETVSHIRFDMGREFAQGNVLIELAKDNPEKAIELARSIENTDPQIFALQGIAVELANSDPEMSYRTFEETMELIESIEDCRDRSIRLKALAECLAKLV